MANTTALLKKPHNLLHLNKHTHDNRAQRARFFVSDAMTEHDSKSGRNELPETARPAWEAYVAMSQSKEIYFSFMVELDQKYKQGGEPTIAENLKLEQLLAEHDKKVTAFNKAMQSMQDMDVDTRNALIRAMGGSPPGADR